MDNGIASSVSSESKENESVSETLIKEEANTNLFTPIKKSQNPMDLYEFRSDEEFDDDSLLMPLRQDRTSTPLRPEKISSLRPSLEDHSDGEKCDIKAEELHTSTLSERNSGEIVESIKIDDIFIEEVVKFAEDNEQKSNFMSQEESKEEEEKVEEEKPPPPKIKKKPGRKSKAEKARLLLEAKLAEEQKAQNTAETTEEAEKKTDVTEKPKAKRGRKPKALKLLEEQEKAAEKLASEGNEHTEEKSPIKPPRKKPGNTCDGTL